MEEGVRKSRDYCSAVLEARSCPVLHHLNACPMSLHLRYLPHPKAMGYAFFYARAG